MLRTMTVSIYFPPVFLQKLEQKVELNSENGQQQIDREEQDTVDL